MATTKTLMTLGDFERLPDSDTELQELDEGELVTMTRPSDRHGEIQVNIASYLREYARKTGNGRVFVETGYVLSEEPATVRGPDVSFLRGRPPLTGKWPKRAPDLAVKVLSPSDTAGPILRKVRQYLGAGAHTVWVVDPDKEVVHAFEHTGASRVFSAEEKLEAPDLLPGFSVPVKSIFE